MKIVVLAGGLSHERDVSLSSGCQITNALREMGNKVLLLDLYEGIELKDSDYGRLFKGIEDGEPEVYCVPKEEPDLDEIVKRNNNGNSFVGKNVIEICKYADIVFMALHGGVGENGKLQGMFDILGIKYTGSGAAGSMLAMDKDLTKKLLRYEGIPTADWAVYNKNENTIDDIIKKIEFPCVIKPCNNGSSVGVAIAENIEQLKESINVAEKIEQDIMVEK